MTDLPFRSGATELSNDELFLLDFLATLAYHGRAGVYQFPQETYQQHMNIRYCHSIPDAEVENVLDNMARGGILQAKPDLPEFYDNRYGLTRHGGDLWCRERMPVWRRYCSTMSSAVFHGDVGEMEVRCVDKQIGLDYLVISNALGHISILDDLQTTEWHPMPPEELVVWHPLPAAWIATIRVKNVDDMNRNRYDELDRQRTWWWTLDELQKFLPE
ncbi:MAG: hypothetical protein IH851_00005 [Armatimonadetes bacterium]|nr:hypothetical protein [Armatimonadota bacterium]